jgi:hypothetical protein
VFQPMDWASAGWDVAAYMAAAQAGSTDQCAAAVKLHQGQASPLAVTFEAGGNYSVATGQPPVNYTLRREGPNIATLVGAGDGCVMLFDVRGVGGGGRLCCTSFCSVPAVFTAACRT